MVYDPQQQRPEQQVANKNRQALNIQQPGEPSDFDRQFFSAESWNKPVVEPEATMGDYVKAAGAGALDMVAGVGQLFKAGNQILDEKNADTAGSAASPLGLDGQMMDVMRQNAGNPLSRAGNFIVEGAGDLAGAASQRIKDSYSEGAKKAASLDFVNFEHNQAGDITGVSAGEGLFDKDAWFINAIPTVAQLLTAGGMSKLGAGAAREMAERATFNRLSKTMPEEAARQIARETADRAAAVAGKTTFVGAMTGTAQGQGGLDMRAQVNGLSFNELMESPTFQSAFSAIDANPSHANLSDSQKLELARSQVAETAANAVTSDPRMLALNIAASTLGDHTLLSLLTKKAAANGILSGAAKGALFEGATEFAQGSGQRYVQNEQLIGTAGQNIDPMQNVLEVGANNAVLGAGLGGSIGAVGGMRGRSNNPAPESNQNSDTNPTAEQSTPVQSQLSPYDEATQRYATMDRAAVLREYANADLSNNADAKRAANERLAGIDREDSVNQFADKYQQQSDDELLVTYRDLNEKAKRSDEEQIQYEAARSVLSQRLGANQPQATQVDVPEWQASGQPSPDGNGSSIPVVKMGDDSAPPGYTGEWRDGEPVISVTQGANNPPLNPENVVGTPQSRIDEFRDTPAYLRQDPRIEEVDGGYAVRLPAPGQQKNKITLPSGEILTVTMDRDVPGAAILTTEDGGQIGLSATQVDGIKSELAGDRPVGGGIGDLARLNAALERIRTHTEHRGYPLFPVDATRRDTGEKVKAWAVQAQPNSPIKMAPKLFDTRAEAISYADRLADRDENNAISRSKRDSERKEKDTAEAVKRAPIDEFLNAQTFSLMQRGKADKALQEMVHYSEFDRPVTRADAVQRLIGRGWYPETAQRASENGRVKTSYRIVSDDGDLYNVTKTEHDFAAHLIAKRDSLSTERQPLPKTDQDQFRRDSQSPQNASKSGGVSVSGADIGGGNIIHDGSFSRDGSKPETGMLRDRVQLAADGFVSHLNGAAKIKVKAVQTQAEAAAMMPNGIPAEFGTVHAIYQPELSRVIVIADNIANARELRAKLRHEVIAHHGLASVIGDVEYDRIMRVLHQTRDSQNKTIQDVWQQVEQSYGQESLETQANEFLAHMAERSELTKLGGVWDRFVTLMTNALRKAGVLNPMDITPAEIRNILRTITGRFQKTAMYANEQPGTREFDNTFSRTDALYSTKSDADPFKPDSYDARQFAQEVGSIASMDTPPRYQVSLGDTPPVYRALGARNLELVMPASVVHKAINPKVRNHFVKLDDMKRLPGLIADPIAVMKSATEKDALVSLVAAHDANGSPVIVAIHLHGKGAGFAEVNKIASVYGKDSQSSLQRQLDNDLLYLNKEKATQWLHAVGLQLPEANTLNGSGQNILSSADIRKNKTQYSRSANPVMDAETSRKMGFNVEKGWFDKAKDFYQMTSDSDRADLKQWWQETFRKLNTKTFDGLAPLKYAEDAAGKSDAMVSGYTAARMSAGSGSVTAAVLEHGLVRYNKNEGITERIPSTGKADSLMGILDGLGNYRENFLKWIAGHRSERLMAEGKENNFTSDEIAYMKSLNRGNEKLFADQKVKYDAFIKSIIDLQQDMGLIDPDSRATWEDAWYLPYYREAENGETHGPWTTRGIANQSSTIRKLKGSDLTIKDPIENLFNYVAKSVDASMKNEAMRRSVTNLADTDMLEAIDNPNKMDYQRIGKNVVKVYIDGQENLVQINDPDLYRAFTMIDLERSKSLFMRAARQAKRVLTIGTTSMPDFIIRNFIRDSVHSWAINKDGFKAIRSSWDGLNKAMRTDNTLVDMMFAGATFGGGYSNVYDPGGTASNIRKVLRRKGYKDSQIREFESSIVRNSKEAMDKMGLALEKYRKVSEGAENANRVATYDAALKAGKSKAQAAFESRDLMDFSMQGSSSLVIGLSDMVPFFNARLQGMSKLGRAIKDDPREVLKRGGYIAGLSLALLALNWGDERYEELQDWDKDAYWHAWFGDQHIRIPKPFEIGLMFGTLPERFARALGGEDTPGKFGKVMAHNFFETMAFNPIPQVTRPIIETFVNYDFFKGGPIEGMADKNVIAGARFNDQTSLLMREIGESTNLSPKMLDHIITGYTGTLGSYILGATNIIMRNLGDNGESASLRVDELPVIKAIFRGSDPAKSTQFTEDFYQMMTKVNQINSTINDYRKQGRHDDANELLQDNREKLSQRKAFTATQKQVKQLNDQIELTRIDRILTADQKRERIDRLMAKRNILVQQTVKRVHPYFD
ncbi:LPD38 domain-containing protein [Pectobacterium versatile]|uniref:LPD38 domain-containing protein n=2 Tax=Pectobacterium versatile TaxID=2488639 RepID=UPI000D199074|nr:LPD38 domain-containing protein [Pectobacterium versatile]AVT58546.1 hypothetical protein OA04_19750 [Pectobacterium versatile]